MSPVEPPPRRDALPAHPCGVAAQRSCGRRPVPTPSRGATAMRWAFRCACLPVLLSVLPVGAAQDEKPADKPAAKNKEAGERWRTLGYLLGVVQGTPGSDRGLTVRVTQRYLEA